MHFFTIRFLLSGIAAILMSFMSLSDPSVSKVYPVPPVNDNSLFYIQRTKNTNAIVYETNMKPGGKIDPENPVKIYWIRYATDSLTDELTSIQRTYAYGVNSRPYNGQKNAWVIQLVAYKKRSIFLLPSAGGKKHAAYMSINGKLAELRKIFVSTSGGTFWFPKVDYIELTGKDPSTQQTVIERFVP